ncbi:DUF6677 family protein [Paenibacillaceae bacterium WGS1546]|uniref:DUF6677 family protein n=1 Tax=Cohnella sp. WGS1546 TaxID=3366810 RepID=UPI00372D0EDC
MNESDQWHQSKEYPLPPDPDGRNARTQEPWQGYGPMPAYAGYPQRNRKRKWAAGLLAFFIPGLGHMYLGLMVKAITLMMLVGLNITAIVYVAIEGNTMSIVLVCLLLPIIYFYNLFDAIQSTDAVNDERERRAANAHPSWGNAQPPFAAREERQVRSLPPAGILVLAGAGGAILLMSGFNWRNWIFDSFGSMLGAIVLLGAGIALWFWEGRGQSGRQNK